MPKQQKFTNRIILLKIQIYTQQAIEKHPFGTMKRAWDFDHIMTKKIKERDSADVGFVFIAYNLKKYMNLIGIVKLLTLIRLKIHHKKS